MIPQTLAHRAYAQTAAPTRTPRDTEYEAISRITRRLKAATARKATDFSAFVQAVHENRRLWGVLATGVADSANALPNDLRARIFYLAEFTEQHSSRVLGDGATVEPLLEINTAVLRGLRQMGAT
ncbi:flagellar biosynthesis regulator FlaF [Ruegeria sp. HKCCA6837]|uniref:flagellar biosynthesis regulator FlaF n=1 Tax=unclassified Ruegeria TaxID=2625375 RepID=UPI001489BD68|nr:flagellar biosynthesis regulator FlaF [Ruegeria sp. HKCCD5849]NOD51780.1 flagellar biosynthesis regulator FlaF [Ruegeria sp. HKCCD5851]NOD68766.1 flagellar biosynthesis regulator FlaF [Ruegeria sp. HKCCD7303]